MTLEASMNSDIKKIFLNKICTIILKPINRNFNEEQNINYFVGSVIDINEEGILMEHPENKCKSFFYKNSIIGLAEELVVYKKDEVKNKNFNPYENIDDLTDVIKK